MLLMVLPDSNGAKIYRRFRNLAAHTLTHTKREKERASGAKGTPNLLSVFGFVMLCECEWRAISFLFFTHVHGLSVLSVLFLLLMLICFCCCCLVLLYDGAFAFPFSLYLSSAVIFAVPSSLPPRTLTFLFDWLSGLVLSRVFNCTV